MLRGEGFDVDVEHGTEVLGQGGLERYDLIVPLSIQVQIARETLQNLIDAVESGSGLGGFHGGMGDTFRNDLAYQFMVGGQWVAHPGDIIDYRVEITTPDDPLVAGIGEAG